MALRPSISPCAWSPEFAHLCCMYWCEWEHPGLAEVTRPEPACPGSPVPRGRLARICGSRSASQDPVCHACVFISCVRSDSRRVCKFWARLLRHQVKRKASV